MQDLMVLADSLDEKYTNQVLVDAKTIQNRLLKMWRMAEGIDIALLAPVQDLLTTTQRSQIATSDLPSLAANRRQLASAPV
jgi:hypothetical protein